MAWLRRGDTGDAMPGGPALTALRELAAAESTGAVSVVAGDPGRAATIFVFQGRPYSAHLEGYDPPIAQRLATAGRLSADKAAELAGEPAGAAGRIAVERGWIDAEDLGSVHQEYMLASLGAVLTARPVKASGGEGSTTARLCTLPLVLDPLLETLRLRAERLRTTWAGLGWAADIHEIEIYATGHPLPEEYAVPEARALIDALAQPATVDDAAAPLGLTRAETVHIVAALARASVVAGRPLPAGTPRSADEGPAVPVPEAFPAPGDATPRARWRPGRHG